MYGRTGIVEVKIMWVSLVNTYCCDNVLTVINDTHHPLDVFNYHFVSSDLLINELV